MATIIINPSTLSTGRFSNLTFTQPTNAGLIKNYFSYYAFRQILPYRLDESLDIASSTLLKYSESAESKKLLPSGSTAILQNLVTIGNTASDFDDFKESFDILYENVRTERTYSKSVLPSILAIANSSIDFWKDVPETSFIIALTLGLLDAAGFVTGYAEAGDLVEDTGIAMNSDGTTNKWKKTFWRCVGGAIGAAATTLGVGSIVENSKPKHGLGSFILTTKSQMGISHNRLCYDTIKDRITLGATPSAEDIESLIASKSTELVAINYLPIGSDEIIADLTSGIVSATTFEELNDALETSYSGMVFDETNNMAVICSIFSIAYYGNMFWQEVINDSDEPLSFPIVQKCVLSDIMGACTGLRLSKPAVEQLNFDCKTPTQDFALSAKILCCIGGSVCAGMTNNS